MIKTLSTAATGMQAQQTNMDVIANNIANVNTTGFKRSRAEFEDLMYQTVKEPGAKTGENAVNPNGVQIGLGVKTNSIQKDFEPGTFKTTNHPFDIAIEGNGFFAVLTPDGDTAYTRNGAFKRGPEGQLIDQNGNTLIPEIRVPGNISGIQVGADGAVKVLVGNSNQPQTIGQIELTNFVNPAGLRAMGKNLFRPSESSGLPQVARPGLNGVGYVAQGQLENSNVNIVDEMVNMITAQRAYETNSKLIQAADQMLQGVNNLR